MQKIKDKSIKIKARHLKIITYGSIFLYYFTTLISLFSLKKKMKHTRTAIAI
jgi:hypothetical protein